MPEPTEDADRPSLTEAPSQVRIRFWICPEHRHDSRVEWRGGVAHCFAPGCELTSEHTQAFVALIREAEPIREVDPAGPLDRAYAEIARLGDALMDARHWARHGYELGQRSCSWSDDGVAPKWLTEGWPVHFPSDLVPAEARVDPNAAGIRCPHCIAGEEPGTARECEACDGSGVDPECTCHNLAAAQRALRQLTVHLHLAEGSLSEMAVLARDVVTIPAADVTWQWSVLRDSNVALTLVGELAARTNGHTLNLPVVRRPVGPWEEAPPADPPPLPHTVHLLANCGLAGGIQVRTTVEVPPGHDIPLPGAPVTVRCSWDGRHQHEYRVVTQAEHARVGGDHG
jgi:hypothetical protein